MNKNDFKLNKFSIGLFELLLITSLIAAIIITLNYFNVIKLSSISSPLTSLPTLNFAKFTNNTSQLEKSNNKNLPLIAKKNPLIVKNNSSEIMYFQIEKSQVYVDTPIDIKIGIHILNPGNDSSGTNGIIFENDTKDNPNYHSISVLYFTEEKAWTLQYSHNNIVDYYSLFSREINDLNTQFNVSISSDGKSISISSPKENQSFFYFKDSLYSETKKMKATLLLSPEAEIVISQLEYII